MGILSSITSFTGIQKYVVIGLGAALIGVSIYATILHSEVGEVKAKLETKTVELTESQADNQQLRNNINAQNKAIDDLKKAADERLANKQQELDAAHVTAQQALVTAQAILKAKPDPKKSSCDNSLDLIRQIIKQELTTPAATGVH